MRAPKAAARGAALLKWACHVWARSGRRRVAGDGAPREPGGHSRALATDTAMASPASRPASPLPSPRAAIRGLDPAIRVDQRSGGRAGLAHLCPVAATLTPARAPLDTPRPERVKNSNPFSLLRPSLTSAVLPSFHPCNHITPTAPFQAPLHLPRLSASQLPAFPLLASNSRRQRLSLYGS